MAVTITCPACAHEYQEASAAEPRTARCPQCQFHADEFANQLLAGFDGTIAIPGSSLFYRLGIVLVAGVMLLLPMVYVSLIAGVIYLEYMHATQWGPALMSAYTSSKGRNRVSLLIIAYLGPLFAGVIMILFMIKPLLAAQSTRSPARKLNPQEEPLLYDFVARLCKLIGATPPKQIEIDTNVNASASFYQGWRGMLTNHLTLTVGAPLVAGLSLRQFTGVLAHEFGHFAQGNAMRLTYVIRSINAWFARVVYERDAWDERLAYWSKRFALRELIAIAWLTSLCVWLTRRILWVLMHLGHGISCFMLRQMEFNADLFETRIAGSHTFVATALRLRLLNLGWQYTLFDLQRTLVDGQLADNVCELLLANVTQLPPEVTAQAQTEVASQKTGWFDTHPCENDRAKNAISDQSAGIFHLDGRTEQLLRDFPRLAREESSAFYRQSLGDKFQSISLVPVAQCLARQQSDRAEATAREDYFRGTFNVLRPLSHFGFVAASPPDLSTAVKLFAKYGAIVERDASQYQEHFKQYDDADTRLLQAEQASALLRGGLKIKPADFKLERSDIAAAMAGKQLAIEQQQACAPHLTAFEKSIAKRFAVALAMLDDPAVAKLLPDAEAWRREVKTLRICAGQLKDIWPKTLELRNASAGLVILLQNYEGREKNQRFQKMIESTTTEVGTQVLQLYQGLQATRYPFEHAIANATVAQYALDELPASDNLGAILNSVAALQSQLGLLASRVASRLALIATSIEEAAITAARPMANDNLQSRPPDTSASPTASDQ